MRIVAIQMYWEKGEMNYKNLLELNTIMKKKWNFKHF